MPADTEIGLLLAEAYPERIAQQLEKQGTRYKLANGRVARLPDHDPLLRQSWLAVAQLDSGSGEGKIFLAAPLKVEDLIQRSEEQNVINWSREKGMIVAVSEKRIGNVVLSSKPLTNIPEPYPPKGSMQGIAGRRFKTIRLDRSRRSMAGTCHELEAMAEW